MDVNCILRDAWDSYDAGRYRQIISMLTPLFKKKKKKNKTLTPEQECRASKLLGMCHRMLVDFKAALPYAKRCLKLAPKVWPEDSVNFVNAIAELGDTELGLKDYIPAKSHFNEAIAILKALGMENSADYGGALMNVANVDYKQQRHKEALDGYVKAKVVLDNFKDHRSYGALLSAMGVCLVDLKRYAEAMVYCRENVEWFCKMFGNQHLNYAISLSNLGWLYREIKQYEFAIREYDTALVIFKRVYGDRHSRTLDINQGIFECRVLQKKDRLSIETDHDYRMCNACLKVDTTVVYICACDKVYYCSDECRVNFFAEHKPDCVMCFACEGEFPDLKDWKRCGVCNMNKYCSDACQEKDKAHKCVARCYECCKDGIKLMKCSACNVASYCSTDCQLAHWSIHKTECKKK